MSDLQEKLSSLANKLGLNRETPEVETPAEKTVAWTEGQSGATVDWDDYDMTTEMVKIYRKAKFHDGKWLYPYVHYNTLNLPVGKVAEKLEELVNSEDWKLLSIQSNGSGMQAVMLTRTTVHELAHPVLLTDLPPLVTEEDMTGIDKWVQEQKER